MTDEDERDALAKGWDRAISDVKARIETLQPGETWLDHSALREFKHIVKALRNPYRTLTDQARAAGIPPRPDADFDIATARPLGTQPSEPERMA